MFENYHLLFTIICYTLSYLYLIEDEGFYLPPVSKEFNLAVRVGSA